MNGHRRAAVLGGLVMYTLILVALVIVVARVNNRVSRQESIRQATIQANYAACIRSIPALRQINGFVHGAEVVADVLLTNAEAMHAITDPGTEVYRTQVANIARLRAAIVAGSGVRIPVPSREVCEARRDAAL